jgi:ABC-type uncharacterized transport system involved in gliding motility auxiliary subunit
MKLKKTHPALKNSLVTCAVLALLAGTGALSTRFPLQYDITAHAGNTLSVASQKLLAAMPEPVKVTAYLKKGLPLRLQISQLLERYRRYKADISLDIIDPDSQPQKTHELAIGPEGAVLVEYQGHSEKLTFVDESTLSNALLQLTHAEQRWISFLTGHGERAPDGIANFAWGQFGKELAFRNITATPLNLSTVQTIPDNSAILVIADPTVPLLAGEIALIQRYIAQGGNLLLTGEPDNVHLAALQNQLGISQPPGALIDNSTRLYGITDPGFVIASTYPTHPITRGLQLISIYPVAAALAFNPKDNFQAQPLLETTAQGQTATPFAYALTRNLGNKQQRIVVLGDSDFLANAYLSNVGNLDVGLRIINWLMRNDDYIDIPAHGAGDRTLNLSATAVALIGFGFLLGLPLVLVVTGFIVWRGRKRG